MFNQIIQPILNNLGTIILVLVIFGPIVANILRAANKAKRQGQSEEGNDDPASSRREELAARRRAELGGGRASSRPGGSDPSNLTMAERIARARAKSQYEQRSADLARGGGRGAAADDIDVEVVEPAGQPDPFAREAELAARRRREQQAAVERRREAERQQAAAADRRRREQAERVRREAARQREAEQARAADRDRQSASSRSTRSANASQANRSPSGGRTRRRSGSGVGEIDSDAISRGEVGTGRSARRIANANDRGGDDGAEGQASVFGVRLTRRTMRHAIVLREVLDPPVSLRPSGVGTPTVATPS